jgi:hypothetical protein
VVWLWFKSLEEGFAFLRTPFGKLLQAALACHLGLVLGVRCLEQAVVVTPIELARRDEAHAGIPTRIVDNTFVRHGC